MPILDDSGIESEDKLSNIYDDGQMSPQISTAQHMVELDVAFRGNGETLADTNQAPRSGTRRNVGKLIYAAVTDSDDGGGGSGSGSGGGGAGETVIRVQPQLNSCRILQRKLELKVERAKRNYSQHLEEQAKKTQTSNLIPISRLPIPGDVEHTPLVDYKSDSSDEPEDISFFPTKSRNSRRHKKAELTDTFSIQEMSIDSDLDSDDSGSQNLELLSPVSVKTNVLGQLNRCFGCCRQS